MYLYGAILGHEIPLPSCCSLPNKSIKLCLSSLISSYFSINNPNDGGCAFTEKYLSMG